MELYTAPAQTYSSCVQLSIKVMEIAGLFQIHMYMYISIATTGH